MGFLGCLSCKELESLFAKLHVLRLQDKDEEASIMHYSTYGCPTTTRLHDKDVPFKELSCHTFAWIRTMWSVICCKTVAEKYLDLDNEEGALINFLTKYKPKFKDEKPE